MRRTILYLVFYILAGFIGIAKGTKINIKLEFQANLEESRERNMKRLAERFRSFDHALARSGHPFPMILRQFRGEYIRLLPLLDSYREATDTTWELLNEGLARYTAQYALVPLVDGMTMDEFVSKARQSPEDLTNLLDSNP